MLQHAATRYVCWRFYCWQSARHGGSRRSSNKSHHPVITARGMPRTMFTINIDTPPTPRYRYAMISFAYATLVTTRHMMPSIFAIVVMSRRLRRHDDFATPYAFDFSASMPLLPRRCHLLLPPPSPFLFIDAIGSMRLRFHSELCALMRLPKIRMIRRLSRALCAAAAARHCQSYIVIRRMRAAVTRRLPYVTF